ncbi:T-cell surface glycoprotein CD3 zeta chain [Sander lucioperca]|uniref:T-cell surface glycoprotein CD3 zeta chain n=1 Tax=Sander lucioperca TaxID=283035 RepID=UPI001653DBCB|nr:T-cell surface glycoprotein CD3 zeta chain [Sander lucioperca]
MELQTWTCGLLVLASLCPLTEAVTLYDPQLCYILDGFLGLYGLIITGMFIHEKFFKIKVKEEEGVYSSLRGQEAGGYDEIGRRDPERGGARSRGPVTGGDDTYTPLNRVVDGTYKALPVKRDRQRKTEQVYQGLSTAHKDTYDKLQMQPLPR